MNTDDFTRNGDEERYRGNHFFVANEISILYKCGFEGEIILFYELLIKLILHRWKDNVPLHSFSIFKNE